MKGFFTSIGTNYIKTFGEGSDKPKKSPDERLPAKRRGSIFVDRSTRTSKTVTVHNNNCGNTIIVNNYYSSDKERY